MLEPQSHWTDTTSFTTHGHVHRKEPVDEIEDQLPIALEQIGNLEGELIASRTAVAQRDAQWQAEVQALAET